MSGNRCGHLRTSAFVAVGALLACTGLSIAIVPLPGPGDPAEEDVVVDFATTMDITFVTVGNPGNAPDTEVMVTDDTSGYGAVDYVYNIGQFEVTAGQYCEFLNAVAKTDTYGLYNEEMWSNEYGCKIQRRGEWGSYTYSVAADSTNRPVNWVSWGDAARFCNWLTNGMPTGAQDATTTEDGSYFLNGATSNEALMAITRKSPGSGGRYYIPTEDEWYKAAYYDPDKPGGAGYWDYPTGSDAAPSNDLTDPDPGNNANFYPSGWTIGSPYYRTEVGEFEDSASPYGTFDMGGNVSEMNETIIESYRGVRGGSFCEVGITLHASDREYYFPSLEIFHVGFRVSEVFGAVSTEAPRVEESRDTPEAAGQE